MAEQIKVAPRPQDRGTFEEVISGILKAAEPGFILESHTRKFAVIKAEEFPKDELEYDLFEGDLLIGATNDPMTAAKFVVEGF